MKYLNNLCKRRKRLRNTTLFVAGSVVLNRKVPFCSSAMWREESRKIVALTRYNMFYKHIIIIVGGRIVCYTDLFGERNIKKH